MRSVIQASAESTMAFCFFFHVPFGWGFGFVFGAPGWPSVELEAFELETSARR